MSRVIGAWKRFTARTAAVQWQRNFFDHRLRGDESVDEKLEYILRNPVRAGLIKSGEQWPFLWQR